MSEHHEIPLIDENEQAPFSKGLMAQSLMSTGLAPEHAYNVAAAVERRLRRRGPAALTLADLQEIARDQLGPERGDVLIERFRQWQKLRRLETPLIILIGGATGVGKSTLATQLAHRLGITRVIGTDMVRQTMRAFFAPELMPAIHTSSFDAASAVRVPVPRETDLSKMGFIEQTKAGADIVQIFDTWAGVLSKDAFLEFSMPYIMRIVEEVKSATDVPVIVFAKGANSSLRELADSGADVLGLDWTVDIGEVRTAIGDKVALQGNLDPVALYASPESIREEVRNILSWYGNNPGHIFNLGHGILPTVPVEHARAMIQAVKDISTELRASEAGA